MQDSDTKQQREENRKNRKETERQKRGTIKKKLNKGLIQKQK